MTLQQQTANQILNDFRPTFFLTLLWIAMGWESPPITLSSHRGEGNPKRKKRPRKDPFNPIRRTALMVLVYTDTPNESRVI